MKVEDRQALRFILEDDIYLLNEDKLKYIQPDGSPFASHQPALETSKPVFNYLGANKKSFLILTYYTDHEFIANEHLAALESVLGRKNHRMEDVAILNMAKNTPDFLEIVSHFKPQTLLILGQMSTPRGIDELKFNQVEKLDRLSVLYTFSFEDMMSSTENKKAFWEQVKAL